MALYHTRSGWLCKQLGDFGDEGLWTALARKEYRLNLVRTTAFPCDVDEFNILAPPDRQVVKTVGGYIATGEIDRIQYY